ncbi:unnamed protein product [Acanthoscelides obtectus]|uniref:Uncharacterized protein n=1 Tax=Acanthoscelides obtectus TaxID=200917 RepID=A0A9P0PDQ4_ACAOB|nr:unnamed protein product [Acanthoscelides obtectus]CAK1685804.1 hypothetical protein AOBTE_LOCUS35628 [Acanthoscelides obtectus]
MSVPLQNSATVRSIMRKPSIILYVVMSSEAEGNDDSIQRLLNDTGRTNSLPLTGHIFFQPPRTPKHPWGTVGLWGKGRGHTESGAVYHLPPYVPDMNGRYFLGYFTTIRSTPNATSLILGKKVVVKWQLNYVNDIKFTQIVRGSFATMSYSMLIYPAISGLFCTSMPLREDQLEFPAKKLTTYAIFSQHVGRNARNATRDHSKLKIDVLLQIDSDRAPAADKCETSVKACDFPSKVWLIPDQLLIVLLLVLVLMFVVSPDRNVNKLQGRIFLDMMNCSKNALCQDIAENHYQDASKHPTHAMYGISKIQLKNICLVAQLCCQF